ncbi:MAG TPA: DUF1501 domain-containing protein [Pirellulales bacterium]|nr:DUF1501 domain-containing protein [Pirellulales bacterium]
MQGIESFRQALTQRPFTRRALLERTGMGLGVLALGPLLGQAATAAETSAAPAIATGHPLAARSPQFPAKAKHIIHLFMNGGPSHVDTFDPKPALVKYAGQDLPFHLSTERKTGTAFPSPFAFQRWGQSGIEVSEIFPHTARCIDDVTVIRSMVADIPNHEPSCLLMNCGEARLPRPSLGSWLTYGLGTENENLPGFVVLCPGGMPTVGRQNWQSAFLPGVFQGTSIDPRATDPAELIQNLKNLHSTPAAQRRQLDLLAELNAEHRRQRSGELLLDARIQSFELAYRMQAEAAAVFDVSDEPQHVLDLYGPGVQGRQMLLARRLVERGVRFVQLWHGAGQPWDSHDDIQDHRKLAAECDQAIGALLTDLKQRGLLDETLVMWGGEFGRTPTVELPAVVVNNGLTKGRDHNHYGFSMWLAGGGVKGGYVHGATDDFGFKAVENKVHVHDLHATILHLMGFDHEKFTYRYAGRDFRLTDVSGRVVREILA